MIKVERNSSLKPFNTFGLEAKAAYLCHISSPNDLEELLNSALFRSEDHYIVGGGSNILFTKDFEGIIIKVDSKGYEIVSEDEYEIKVKVSAGTNWHAFVQEAVRNDWGGIENLSLIPGTMGAAPIQNIGAYGVEIKNVIDNVEVIDLITGALKVFTKDECQFGYRESVFKRGLQKKIFISSVTLTLTKKDHHFNTHYDALRSVLEEKKMNDITIKNISDAVISIRQSKLPDPAVVGNAGSFFKNPTITLSHYEELKKEFALIPSYPIDNQNVKVPAGWLIENCNWKGKKINQVGVHPKQALVLVNYGGGSGQEILNLSKKIQQSVKEKFQITLTPEVNIL